MNLASAADQAMTIGKVAKLAEIGIETIRFYEREGLLEEPVRTRSGYRLYSEDAVKRLRFIKKAKELGFTLKEILDLLSLKIDPKATKADVKNRVEAKIAGVQEKIETLKRIQRALKHLAESCDGHGPIHECPIIEALEAEEADL